MRRAATRLVLAVILAAGAIAPALAVERARFGAAGKPAARMAEPRKQVAPARATATGPRALAAARTRQAASTRRGWHAAPAGRHTYASPRHHAAHHGHATDAQRGIASTYGTHLTGRRMASGRAFDPDDSVVAHRTLPFGTLVRVTNLANGRSAEARVEDRGPFIRGRIIDVSPRTAAELGMGGAGTVPVAVRAVAPAAADGVTRR